MTAHILTPSRRDSAMMRECRHCHRPFTPKDFVKEESKNMEADRKRLGLEGVRFLYYSCPDCKHDDIFLDVHHREGETPEEFQARRDALELAVRQTHSETVEVTITERA
jgi:hypothetical protein